MPLWKGFKHTEETKRKIGEASKLHHKLGTNRHDQLQTPESHRKAGESLARAYAKGKHQKIRYFLGKKFTIEHRQRISETRKRLKLPNPFHKGHTINPKGVHRSPHTEFKKGDPRQREIGLKGRMTQIFPKKHTTIELIMQKELSNKGISYEMNKSVLGICQPDIVISDKKVAVFCDGDYWHNRMDYIIRDGLQNETLRDNGWIVLRFWEHEIKNNLEECVNKVTEVAQH